MRIIERIIIIAVNMGKGWWVIYPVVLTLLLAITS